MWLRWVTILTALLLTWACGYTVGMNHGWDTALNFDPSCKQFH